MAIIIFVFVSILLIRLSFYGVNGNNVCLDRNGYGTLFYMHAFVNQTLQYFSNNYNYFALNLLGLIKLNYIIYKKEFMTSIISCFALI